MRPENACSSEEVGLWKGQHSHGKIAYLGLDGDFQVTSEKGEKRCHSEEATP